MPNSKLSSLIPDISLKTSYRNPLKELGLSGTGVTDKANALLSKYKQYTAVDLSDLSPTGQTSRASIVEEAAKQRLRELAQLENSTSAEAGTASHSTHIFQRAECTAH